MDAAIAHRERKQLNFSTIVDFPSQNRVSFLSHSDKKDPQLRLRVLFCAGAGRIRTGRPSADGKKQSCGLFFRPRLANPPAPTKKLWQRYCRSFFSLLHRTKSARAMTDFQSAFYRDVQLLPGGWIFSGCRKTLVGASIARLRPFALQETIPENALLR